MQFGCLLHFEVANAVATTTLAKRLAVLRSLAYSFAVLTSLLC